MATEVERNWTAQIVIASDHAGLKPYFKALEGEILHVLARVDDPRWVKDYLIELRLQSRAWLERSKLLDRCKLDYANCILSKVRETAQVR